MIDHPANTTEYLVDVLSFPESIAEHSVDVGEHRMLNSRSWEDFNTVSIIPMQRAVQAEYVCICGRPLAHYKHFRILTEMLLLPLLKLKQEPECDSHPRCTILGIEGNCCPTNAGIYLGCCDLMLVSIHKERVFATVE